MITEDLPDRPRTFWFAGLLRAALVVITMAHLGLCLDDAADKDTADRPASASTQLAGHRPLPHPPRAPESHDHAGCASPAMTLHDTDLPGPGIFTLSSDTAASTVRPDELSVAHSPTSRAPPYGRALLHLVCLTRV